MAAFDLLFSVSDLPPLVFSWLDSSSLALAACVCWGWRDLARRCRDRGQAKFRLILADLVADAPLLAWAAANLNEKQLSLALQAKICDLAAKKGALLALQWARENRCPWYEETCAYAALNGHLATLRWARKNGCPCDKWTCANAAYGGHLEVLQWAHENGCEWDSWTCASAARASSSLWCTLTRMWAGSIPSSFVTNSQPKRIASLLK